MLYLYSIHSVAGWGGEVNWMDSDGLRIGSSVLVSGNMTINNSGGGAWAGTVRCHPTVTYCWPDSSSYNTHYIRAWHSEAQAAVGSLQVVNTRVETLPEIVFSGDGDSVPTHPADCYLETNTLSTRDTEPRLTVPGRAVNEPSRFYIAQLIITKLLVPISHLLCYLQCLNSRLG